MTRSYKNTISTFVPQRLRIIISTKPPQEYKEFLKVKDKQNGRTLLQDTVENIIELLQHESKVSLLLPPPRFSDKLNVLFNSTESRYYVVVQIFESKVVLELVSFCKCIYFFCMNITASFLFLHVRACLS